MTVDDLAPMKEAASRTSLRRLALMLAMVGLGFLATCVDATAQGPGRTQVGSRDPYGSLAKELGEKFPAARARAQGYLNTGPVNDPTKGPVDFTSSEEVSRRKQGYTVQSRHILIQYRPNVKAQVLSDFLESLNLKVVSGALEIGLLVAEVQGLPGEAVGLDVADDPDRAQHEIASLKAKINALRAKPEIISTAAENIPLGSTCIPAYNECSGRAFDGEKGFDADWIRNPAGDVREENDGNWGQKRARFPAAWNFNDVIQRAMDRERRGNIPIAILDVGFSPHRDLEFRDLDPADEQRPHWHGTHIAGIIAAKWNNSIGINGCTQFADLSVRRLGAGAGGGFGLYVSELYIGVSKLIVENPGLKIINISLGSNWVRNFRIDPDEDGRVKEQAAHQAPLARALADLAAVRGIILVVSAGNDSRTRKPRVEAKWSIPLNYVAATGIADSPPASNVLVVEALSRAGTLTEYSNYKGSIAAFGDEVLSTIDRNKFDVPKDDLYVVMSGTSQAAPQVASLIANMYAYNPKLTMEQVVSRLKQAAVQPAGACELSLISSKKDAGDIPKEGKNLIVVATVDQVLHFRFFDGEGKVIVDTDEKKLTKQAPQIQALRKRIDGHWPPHLLTPDEKGFVIDAVASIVGHPLNTSAKVIDAFAAMLACYDDDRPLHDLADLDSNGQVDLDDFDIFHRALHQVDRLRGDLKDDLNGDGRKLDAASENVWPRADLNGSGKLSHDPADRRMVKGQLSSDLEVMKRVWEDAQIPGEQLDARLDQPAPPPPAAVKPRRPRKARPKP